MGGVFAILAGLFGLGGIVYHFYKKGAISPVSVPSGTSPDFSATVSGAPNPNKSGIGTAYDGIISQVANTEGADPILLKAIVKKESNFDEEAVNPETTFTLGGVTYGPNDSGGRKALHDFISGGGDPASIGLNPSLGLAQVRVGIGKAFIPGLEAIQLFDPETNLTASARLLKQLAAAGITLDTIDAYNEGQALDRRNLPYRDE
ncbi:MAG: transglycosylase SLT domain-containing protein, partial [Candidatus Dormibacteria bacterium]